MLRPPPQNPRFLPNSQADPWPVLDGLGEHVPRLMDIVAGIEQAIDLRAVPRPLLDLVEVADIGNELERHINDRYMTSK